MKVIFESSANQRVMLANVPLDATMEDLVATLNGLLGKVDTPIQASQLQATQVSARSLKDLKTCIPSTSIVDQVASLEVVVKTKIPFDSPPPRGGTSILFAGQGTDVGRTVSALLSNASPEAEAAVRKLFSRASSVLGYDLLDVCLNEPDKLNTTLFSQPAIVVASLAGVEVAKASKSPTLADIKHVAGFSLGEYTALIYAGAVSFEDGIRLVQARAQAMDEETRRAKGSMVTVMGLNDDQLNALCATAQASTAAAGSGNTGTQAAIQIANYLFPKARVLSGGDKLVQWVVENASQYGALMAKELRVAGAFHSPYMQGARIKLKEALANVTITLPQGMNLYSNVTAQPYTSAEQVKVLLEEQLVAPVRWEQSVVHMRSKLEVARFLDAGPGMQLKTMMRRIDPKAFHDTALLGK